MYWKTFSF